MEQVGAPEFVPQIQQRAAQTLRVSGEKERYVTICGDDFVYRYDSMTGAFAAMAVRAKEMLLAPMAYNIWRARRITTATSRTNGTGIYTAMPSRAVWARRCKSMTTG